MENSSEYIEENIETSIAQGKTLARNIAATSVSLLYEKDFAAIEEILIQSSAFPSISSIQVSNHHGMVISNVIKNSDGKIKAHFDQIILTPPSTNGELLIENNNNFFVWEQIGNGLGWVRVNYNIGNIRSKKNEKITHALSEAALSIFITALLLIAFLRKPIRALKSITTFSETLGNNQGAQLEQSHPSVEIQSLVSSLNHISDTLYKDNKKTFDEINRLTAYKFSTDKHSIVSITRANGRILSVNDNFCSMSGYNKDELANQNHNLISSGLHEKEFFRDMWSTILDGNVWQGEICNQNKYGKLYWVKSTVVPILDEEGRPYQFIAVSNDITAEKKYRTTLENLSAFPQHNPHITISVDSSGEIMYTNMSAVKLMVQLAIAHKSVQRMLPEDMMAFINASLESDTVIRDIEVAVLDTNWLWSIHPLPNQNMVLCYAVDISASEASMRKQREVYQALENKYLELQKEMELNEIASTTADSVLPKTTTKS